MEKRAWENWKGLLDILMWVTAGLGSGGTAPPGIAAADPETTLLRKIGEFCGVKRREWASD